MDPLLTRLRRAVGDEYTIEHELGRGGMAVVFLGRDRRLERRVALKVFEREGQPAQATERFLREIRIAAQLQHPNILPVFASSEGEGLVYYIMPYVAGATLRERLERERRLPVMDAVRIARDVALALEHAHGVGIVHRDIKPDNIMLVSGAAVVADFGIARAREQGGERLTDDGLAIGTPNYMSPEQATASPQVDGRADIYALGCVLYEMLVGQPPFSGPTAQAVMARHTADPAPPLHTVRDVPHALETVVFRALAKAPAERWQTGRAFAEGLEEAVPLRRSAEVASGRRKWLRIGAGAVGAIALATLAWFVINRSGSANVGGTETVKSVAVLPFTAVGDTERGILADGVTEGVITGLVHVEGLGVLSSSRVLAYRDRPIDPREAGRELGVSTVVSGGVQVAGNGFRVTAQLTNVADGLVLWREQFDGELLVRGQLQDVFSIQDAITERIVEALRPRLGTTMQVALARGVRTRDPLAYDLYLEARRLTARVEQGNLDSAVALLKQAIRRDSMYADAWAALADAYSFMADWGSMPPSELAPAIRRAVDRAIALDEQNGKAFAMRGYLRVVYDWDFDGAQRDLRRAVELAPASANLTVDYAWFLELTGRRDSAVAQMRRAVAIEPTNSFVLQNLALRLYHAGEVESTIKTCRQAIDIDSTFSPAYWLLANAYLDTGKRDQADSAHARWRRYSSEYYPMTLALSSVYYRRAGNRDAAEATLERLLALRKRRYVSPTAIGVARLAVGDRAGALSGLEAGARNNDLELVFVLIDLYGPLRGDPRFEAVRRRVFGDRPFPSTPFR